MKCTLCKILGRCRLSPTAVWNFIGTVGPFASLWLRGLTVVMDCVAVLVNVKVQCGDRHFDSERGWWIRKLMTDQRVDHADPCSLR